MKRVKHRFITQGCTSAFKPVVAVSVVFKSKTHIHWNVTWKMVQHADDMLGPFAKEFLRCYYNTAHSISFFIPKDRPIIHHWYDGTENIEYPPGISL